MRTKMNSIFRSMDNAIAASLLKVMISDRRYQYPIAEDFHQLRLSAPCMPHISMPFAAIASDVQDSSNNLLRRAAQVVVGPTQEKSNQKRTTSQFSSGHAALTFLLFLFLSKEKANVFFFLDGTRKKQPKKEPQDSFRAAMPH